MLLQLNSYLFDGFVTDENRTCMMKSRFWQYSLIILLKLNLYEKSPECRYDIFRFLSLSECQFCTAE
jgi:hypothetical protein